MQLAVGNVGRLCAQELEPEWTLQLLVSPDRLAAYLQVELNGDDKKCPAARVLEFVRKCGVHLSDDERAALPGVAEAVGKGTRRAVIIATGLPPRAAQRGIKWYVPMEDQRRAEAFSRASVDTREVSRFVKASAGQNLCELLYSAAADGADVFGEPLPALVDPAATQPLLRLGKGVVFARDGCTAVAEHDGCVELTDGVLSVSRVLEVKGNVDYKIGNIDFVGAVTISGDVLPGFKIKATGDVRVGGVVERASVETDGNLSIKGGATGRHSATLRAGGNIEAGYLHMIDVTSGADVIIHTECLDSQVTAGGHVLAERGAIIGGAVRANGNVRAALVGSDIGVPTMLWAGRESAASRELTDAEKAVATAADRVKTDERAIALLVQTAAARAGATPNGSMIDVIRRQLEEHQRELEQRQADLAQVVALYNERAGAIEIGRKAFANVTLRVGEFTRVINAEQAGPVRFQADAANGTLAARSG